MYKRQVNELAKYIKSKGILTYLESSCFDSQKFSYVLPSIDFVKIEFKTKDSEMVDTKHYADLIKNTLECLDASIKMKKITYIKIVVSSKTELDNLKTLLGQIFKIASIETISGFIIQPTYGVSEPSLEKLLEFYDLVYPYYRDVRVIPQLQKIIDVP